ncbi:MAG TPA: MarR family winged helix-turn-helix transcriptional regulator [Solirubrobacteraceae bacterium]|nr:MarR family winged helix-turn-helix transcriptional regulator [Solirubrobacteraceae bacterium]
MSTASSPPVSAGPERPVDAPAGRPREGSAFYDPSTPTGQVGVAFKRAMVAVRRLRGRETQRIGQLSYAQYGLLHGLSGSSECSARELAAHTDLSPATVTQMLEHLEAAGLVTRKRSEEDRRVVLSVLTDRGAAVVAARQHQMEARWTQALAECSDAELAAAAKVLHRVADVFDGLSLEGQAEPLSAEEPSVVPPAP